MPQRRFVAKCRVLRWAPGKPGSCTILGIGPTKIDALPQARQCEGNFGLHGQWAGCSESCKSTGGGCVIRGSHFIKGWSKTQQSITFSSTEAQLVAMSKAAAELIGCMSMWSDFGEGGRWSRDGVNSVVCPAPQACNAEDFIHAVVCGDRSAAIAICGRRGARRLEHI